MVTGYWSPRGLELGNGDALAGQVMPNTLAFAERAGTPYIALDNRPYRFGKLVLRLQDDHGLLPLNFPDRYTLAGLLREYGVAYDERDVLIDRLLDYIDRSAGVHLNGADAADYLSAGRPPPRNAPLLTPWELHRILGWDRVASLWQGDDPITAVVTTRDLAGLNPNTAPAAVLRAVAGLDSRAVAGLLRYRAKFLLTGTLDFERATGVALAVNPMFFYFSPASSLRLTLVSPHDPLRRVVAIRVAPVGASPYRIDYEAALPRGADERALLDRIDGVPPLPAAPASPDSALAAAEQ
jgi:hypothetical protein